MSEIRNPREDRLSLESALEHLLRIQASQPGRELRIVIKKSNPGGLTAHQTTEIKDIYVGFDWEAGRIVLVPARPLTEVSEEDVRAIYESLRKGSSWHAYERERKLLDKIKTLEAEVAKLKAPTA